ncbi:Thoeris anti-defense Tad2 family protein [Xenorhabdus szentirmaii]|uniref:Uncharacterized protein n=1 Tax=Xenorhabdus szentirmaii DSM 16338 TaxID=1427518 RepID=W1J5I0_9GAMM|nr:MW1434 family type I TA system toxin [Xenorhabdus szentirmaii]PHM35420.1 hypothetical protein Xsze_01891 [Xenorhabdus szentirmaii DSM 16338]CDL84725.1 conserved hypothetical protein [Xenorhabdus szentirmaii DSM 16338]
MSDVDKLDNENTETQCQIDPNQYKIKIDTVTAPVGSCPWAIIQVYLGNMLHRSDWDIPNEYMRLTSKKPDNNSVYIEKSDRHGHWFPWQPTPEDLMACDWKLVKLEDCMLSFDLKIGTGKYSDTEQMWGYLADNELESGPNREGPFGTLTNLQNKTDITTFSSFVWDNVSAAIFIRVSSGNPRTSEGYQKMINLLAKNLTVTVGEVSYHLGSTTDSSIVGKQQYEFFGQYSNAEAKKLGNLLKQSVGKILHFCLNWK